MATLVVIMLIIDLQYHDLDIPVIILHYCRLTLATFCSFGLLEHYAFESMIVKFFWSINQYILIFTVL